MSERIALSGEQPSMGEMAKLAVYLLGLSRGIQLSRLTFIGVIAAGIASGLSMAALIAVTNSLIINAELGAQTMAWGFSALVLLRLILRFLSQVLLLRLTERSFFALRVDLCKQVLAAPLRHLEELGKHRLMAAIAGDVGQIAPAIVLLPTLVMHIAVIFGFLVYLGWLYWPLLPVLFVFTAFGVLTSQFVMNKAVRRIAVGREWYDKLFQHFRAVTEGTKELKMHQRRRREFLGRLEGVARIHRREMRRADVLMAVIGSWSEMLFFVLVGIFLLVVPQLYPLSPSILIGYAVTILMMRTPIEGVVNGLPTLTQAAIAVGKIQTLSQSLIHRSIEEEPCEPLIPGAGWKVLELVGVTHTYRGETADEHFLLGPIDLTLRPGELVFIAGGNGSGKTTLAKTLLGIYAPEKGEIYLDDEEIVAANRDRYRQHFSVVFSDFFLFQTFLGFDSPDLDKKAQEYLERLNLHKKVKVINNELSTVELSQGQRKRLALLSAYLEDRPIYLFDEWAADQDPQFKEVFYFHLLPELRSRGKTVIVISHDDQYYGVADRIIRLDYGKVQFGSSAESVGKGFTILPEAQMPAQARHLDDL